MFFQFKNFTGAVYLNEKNEVNRTGGIMYTIKGGVIYDSKNIVGRCKKMVFLFRTPVKPVGTVCFATRFKKLPE
jgi:hypothetical protein